MTQSWADYIVTGGCGFIGSAFLRHMVKQRPSKNFLNIDNLVCGTKASVASLEGKHNYQFFEADITDEKKMMDLVHPGSTIINFAAESHVDNSINDSRPFLDTNIYGTFSLLEAARKNGVSKFVQVSTDEVYGALRFDSAPWTESSPRLPRSPYSASKAAAEEMAEAYMHTHGVPVVISRSSNNFGPFQHPEKVIPLFITNILEGKKVPLYGKGQNIRDWIGVEDNVYALEYVTEHGIPGEVYNIGANNEVNNLSLTHKILNLMGHGQEMIEYVTDRKGHDFRYALNSNKVQNLGWVQPSPEKFDEKLSRTIDWYKQNRSWWEPLKEDVRRKRGIK